MNISGLQKTTLLDYPGHVAATIFLGGCNFRCPFCHNMNIVLEASQEYTKEDILKFLTKRSGVLDGVCITGGEPTLYNDLPDFIQEIKKITKQDGSTFLVKLDTNGTNPDMLKGLIDSKLIDYVAMDIKSSLGKYDLVAGISEDNKKTEEILEAVNKSVNILKASKIDYEFRTTLVDKYHDEEEIIKIGELINGAKKYYMQSFIDSENVIDHSLGSIEKDVLLKYLEIMKKYVDYVSIRGVD